VTQKVISVTDTQHIHTYQWNTNTKYFIWLVCWFSVLTFRKASNNITECKKLTINTRYMRITSMQYWSRIFQLA